MPHPIQLSWYEHRRLQAQAYSGIARVILNHAYSYHEDRMQRHMVSISVHRSTYSVQCSDKICFLQLRIKCGVATSCPCTHTALQAPMSMRPLRVCFWANCLAARPQLCVYIQSRVAVIVVAIINKSPTYSVLCFQGFRVKWEDHIRIWCCHKVSPNGVDVDASVVCKVSHIENWQHPTNKKM